MNTLTAWSKAIVTLSFLVVGFSCVADEIHWGAETNGYRGGVLVFGQGEGSGVVVKVYAQQPDSEVRPPTDISSITNTREKKIEFLSEYTRKSMNPPYRVMITTNWSPGPMKLCDAKGQEVPALDAEVLKPTFFPEMPRWDYRVSDLRPMGTGIYPCNVTLFGVDASEKQDVVASISLGNYFRISEPGIYQFTVWPKIYKQSKTNKDVYLRIDLPPVTIPIKWEGQQTK